MAVFVHRGQLADSFEPGNYTLTTDNLPILSTLQGWKYGFNSTFRSEVYFVSTRQITELKWGTQKQIMLREDDLGPVRLRESGCARSVSARVTTSARYAPRGTARWSA